MGKSRVIKMRIPVVFILCLGAVSLTSCSSCSDNESECRLNNDCAIGEICVEGNCQQVATVDTGSGTGVVDTSSGSTGTAVSSDSVSASSGETDTGLDSTSDSVADTETVEVCSDDPTVTSGQSCTSNCECLSGYCNNGFCCDSGVCCNQSGDCPVSPCGMQHCARNSCVYTYTSHPCGTTAVTGEQTCTDGNVCDGAGNCVPVAQDCAPYAAKTDESDCSASPAQMACYDGCTSADASVTCAPGNSCQDGKCVAPDAQPNGSACTGNSGCVSGYCANGFCCDGGECCGTAADCGDMCVGDVACSGEFQCTVLQYTGCGQADGAGNLTCDADGQRCDGYGNCVVVEDCRTENGLQSYRCSDGGVVQNCGCESNDDCDADTEFCNDGFICVEGVCDFSEAQTPCPAGPCRPGASCDESTRSCTVSTSPCDAVASACDPKKCVVVDTDAYECVATPFANGHVCDDELGCNGTSDFCLDGECVGGGAGVNYCYNPDPCASDYTCTENGFGVAPTCTPSTSRAVGDNCSNDFSCYGAGATCQLDPGSAADLVCVQSEEVCMTNGICASYVCSEDYSFSSETGVSCNTVGTGDNVTISCDNPTATIAVADGKFTTRGYFDYNATCNPGSESFVGMETRIYVNTSNPVADATLTITDIDSTFTGNLEMLLFDSNPCLETNCIQRGTGSLTFSSDDAAVIVVLDSVDAMWPPSTVTVELDCNNP